MKLLIAIIVMSLGICSVLASPNSSKINEENHSKKSSEGAGPGV